MRLQGLIDLLKEYSPYRLLVERLGGDGAVQETNALDGVRPYLLAALWHHLARPLVVVCPRPEDARRLYDALLTYMGDQTPLYLFPEPEVLPYERLAYDASITNQRLSALTALLELSPKPSPLRLCRESRPREVGVGPVSPSPLIRERGKGKSSGGHPSDLSRVSMASPSDQTPVISTSRDESFKKDRVSEPPLVVTSISSALIHALPAEVFRQSTHTVATGHRLRLEETLRRWVSLGYRHEPGVEIPGTFSRRGGILDIYPPISPLPTRIELLGDTVETVRLFDPSSQRSVRQVESVTIIPARDVLPTLSDKERAAQLLSQLDFTDCQRSARERIEEELSMLLAGQEVEDVPFYAGFFNTGCFLDYLSDETLVVLDEPSQVESEALAMEERSLELRRARETRGELPRNFPSPVESWPNFSRHLEERPRLLVNGWTGPEEAASIRPPISYHGAIEQFVQDLGHTLREGARVVVVSRHARRLSEILRQADIGVRMAEELESIPEPGSVTLVPETLRQGWTLPLSPHPLVLFSDAEVWGTVKERRPRRVTPVKRGLSLSELEPGGYVVHVDHGIARFAGTTQIATNGDQKEYLVLEYSENDRLYVPTDHLDRVSRYVADSERPPTLTRLGTAEWARVKERVKRSAKELAQELLDLYAARERVQGIVFSSDSMWQQELEDAFPYEETADQERTIGEVKQNMEQPQPMDRLVCGDVGYGKTEVALRAAFKAVQDGYQVSVLVPTTILAQQHYATFSERLAPFPVRVEVLSRFRTPKEQDEVLQGLLQGTVDVVIGTHRLLQKDVQLKNLGLVVVDEEQRFGVAHKERFKQMRRQVDVLTLSATPIPRTLYMSLSGIRDMSTMETPPEERLPVKTYVSEYSDELVKEAILREMERGGQVFFLHNRVRTIQHVADNIRQLVPHARVAIGHGQMPEEELEEVMLDFTASEVDVLVCTTIIESGLDIPNANTLIIDRADRLGLAQLYQLRGRVGRASQRAHCYLLVPRGRRITPSAEKRLKAILEAAELGAGFRLAMRDLEIRGAGNILGPEQSGYMHAVGFELYNQLLREAVQEVTTGQGEESSAAQPHIQLRMDLPLSAHIPEGYVPHLPTRLAVYQRLARTQDIADVQDVQEELHDRFGPLPISAQNLLYVVRLRIMAQEAGVESVTRASGAYVLSLDQPVGGASPALEKALGPGTRVGNLQIHLSTRDMGKEWQTRLMQVMERLKAFRQQVSQLVG